MHRFFLDVPGKMGAGETLFLPDKIAHQVRDVLHIGVGEQLVLLDNSGDELLCVVTQSSRVAVEIEVRERRTGKDRAPVQIILCQGLLKSARFEWILEKGTELGVTTFVPTVCQRSMAGLEEAGSAKFQRWQRIIQEATEQCGRTQRPALSSIRSLKQAIEDIPAGALAIMPWEEEQELSLHAVLHAVLPATALSEVGPFSIVLFIGPEGGLQAEEVALAKEHGVHSVTLGTRILRAETAALVTVANVMYELGARV